MYAQITHLKAPMGKMANLRRLIAEQYLPDVQGRDGFVSAHLLEQIDDPDTAQLLIFWDSQDAVERATGTGLLRQTVVGLVTELPGLQVQRQGYIIRVSLDPSRQEA